jgi:hypothetical protein
VNDQVIEYAPGTILPVHSRAGVAGFACGVLSAVGVVVTMVLIARPIPGPMGGWIRGGAALFGVLVLGMWVAAIALGVIGVRERNRNRSFPRAALATSGVALVLFVLMILLMY